MKEENLKRLQKLKKINSFLMILYLMAYGCVVFSKNLPFQSAALTGVLLSSVTYSSVRKILFVEKNEAYKASFIEWATAIIFVLLIIVSLVRR